MKKYASILTALCIATAMCACVGCAPQVTTENNADALAPAVEVSADSTAKVILCPGYYGTTSKLNTISGDGVTKLTAAEEKTYFVENAYFVNLTVGADLPKPTAASGSKLTFVGWRYAKDGELVTVDKMPSVSETLYLYAEWTAKK